MANLIINHFNSRCGECGRAALPYESAHLTKPGYNYSGPGCGAVFTTVSSDYTGLDDIIKGMRPDLEYIGALTVGFV